MYAPAPATILRLVKTRGMDTVMIHKHIMDNGMVVLGEPMEAVESVAFCFLIPAGASVLPEGCCGASNVILDWIFRGAGPRSSRELSDALDSLGLHRAGSVGSAFISIGAALEAGNLSKALDLYADVILRPTLDPEQYGLAQQLAMHEVTALDDDPRQKVMLTLREKFYPHPLGRNTVGNIDELSGLTHKAVAHIVQGRFCSGHMIVSVAGKYDFDRVCAQLEGLFGSDNKEAQEAFVTLKDAGAPYTHIHNDGAQVHIGLMTGTVTLAHDQYYNVRLAESILSGGMSARLFTEVREKRGLCYAIGARYHGLKQAAGIMCYAGTTPDKAQQTLDVIRAEFDRLAEDISDQELNRAKVGLKSALILQSESSGSRTGAIAGDYHHLGRVRSLDEIKECIEACTVQSVVQCLKKKPMHDFTVVTIGPQPINV
jgi:predicted Zn-dependent peptidase